VSQACVSQKKLGCVHQSWTGRRPFLQQTQTMCKPSPVRSATKKNLKMEAAACEFAVCLTQAQVVMFGISLVLGWLGTVIFSVTLVNERLDKAQMGISHAFEVGEIRLQHSIERLNEMYSK